MIDAPENRGTHARCCQPPAGRDDLRLAFCILTTYWYRRPNRPRLRITDLPAFHRAFGHDRFAIDDSVGGTLSRAQSLNGAARLLGAQLALPIA
jgi:hypothetical protein